MASKREVIPINILEFLQLMYGDCEDYFITLWAKKMPTKWLSINDLNAIAETAKSIKNDVYFGVGLSKNKKSEGRMSVDDIDGVPSIWLDLDLKDDTHPNNPETVDVLMAYVESLPLQPSVIVFSGHGIHCHWIFREFLTIESPDERMQVKSLFKGWQSFIRKGAAIIGWKVDSTFDLSRVLRLPETTNSKYPNEPIEVTVISHNDNRFNPSDFDCYISEEPEKQPKKREKFKRLPSDGPAKLVIDNCIFIQKCVKSAKTLTEPNWLAMISNIARCSDGPEMCHELSKPYDGYSYEETEDKIAHVLNDMHGPQTCKYIQDGLGFSECPSDCGVKSPCSFALTKKSADPIPADFWETEIIEPPKIKVFTDLGNAEYFAKVYEKKIKYCIEMEKWLIWYDGRWNIDYSNNIVFLAGKCVRGMCNQLADMADDDAKKKLFKHSLKSEDASRLKAFISIAKSYLPVSIKELDQDSWLINCQNGIIDLKTGELLPHDPSKNMMRMIKASYDSQAKCPLFEKFINDIFDGNKNVIQFMQRFLGYCLTGDTREQQFIIAHGSGRNGKGTLLNLILYILDDYTKSIPSEVLYVRKNEKPSNEIARLAGARFVLASEGEKGKRLDEPLVKKLTGQDLLSARFLYKESFEFMPNFKIAMMVNDKPVASQEDVALWARIQLVPFNKKFEGANQDKNLAQNLRKESEINGILQWLIEGCLEWQRIGLNPPDEVLQATNEYRSENDRLKDWEDENCVVDSKLSCRLKDLYRNYQAWCLEAGERYIIKQKEFSANLIQKGFIKYEPAGIVKFKGIGIRTRYSDEIIRENQNNW